MSDAETTRPVRMSPELMERFASRSSEGYLLTWDWGEPDEEGFYTPTVTTHGDDRLVPEITEERLADVLITLGPPPDDPNPGQSARNLAAAILAALTEQEPATPVTPEGGEL